MGRPARIVPFRARLKFSLRVLAADRKSGDDDRETGRGDHGTFGSAEEL